MIDALADILREYPTLALFLTLGLGFLIGKVKIGNFSPGSVTAVLLVGVVVGQAGISMSGPLKTVFFMMFLFAVGYSVGPDFFKSLRGQGARQALFALLMSSMCFAVTLLISAVMNYSKGETVGLFSGSQTCSALLGVGSEAIGRLDITEAEKATQLNIIPVCYAVTYIFGTLGTVVLLGNFGPKLLGGLDVVKKKTQELENELNGKGHRDDPAFVNAMRTAVYRAYVVEDSFFASPKTVRETEQHLRSKGLYVHVDRLCHKGHVTAPGRDDIIEMHDDVVICGRKEYIVSVGKYIGHETANMKLLSYPLERIGVVVAKKDVAGLTVSELRKKKFMRGVIIRDIERGGKSLDFDAQAVVERSDKLSIVGRPIHVMLAARHIGHAERPSVASDLMFVGLAIFIGGLLGAMSFWIGDVPISFGTSGGALLAGLVFGWLRSKRPTYGQIPPAALWIMNNLGLNVFIAVVGIEAAPSFVAGIKAVGPMLFLAGAVGTLVPLLFGLWLGHKVFKFNPAITLGCCAGTRTCTASLGAVQDALGSTLPAIGYTVTYAVSNILLVVWGMLTVALA
ncbi:MAG: aspartate-alanine antiporter [Firmicutes bacterium]|nr:aspartate-alanine antiporter [Bacillota bacterium]MCM1401640.1 aspartate-alanine antiporter [Bacteroides sp.]MCM1477526.1 aspartate-alanine antiporter [Bacteroides sp.]